MRVGTLVLTYAELRQALLDYSAKYAPGQPSQVLIQSPGRQRITVEMQVAGRVTVGSVEPHDQDAGQRDAGQRDVA